MQPKDTDCRRECCKDIENHHYSSDGSWITTWCSRCHATLNVEADPGAGTWPIDHDDDKDE